MLLISMPNSAIKCVPNAHTPKNKLLKGSGWGKENFLLRLFDQNESDIRLDLVMNSSAYMRNISLNSFIIM